MPPRVAQLAAGRPLVPVWVNGLGGVTFRDAGPAADAVGPGATAGAGETSGASDHLLKPGARFIKWMAAGTPEIDFPAEAARLAWAREHGASVPEVLTQGADADGSWLVTAELRGDSAVAARWLDNPRSAGLAIGTGLKALHDTLPVRECPFSWSIEERVGQFEARIAAGGGPAGWDAAYRELSVAEVRARLQDAPEVTDPVVCHGDACAPNTLLSAQGSWVGHVDLGGLGVADRWADLAVAAWSMDWNYGPGFEQFVYEGYGIDPDPERIAYYRLLWDVS